MWTITRELLDCNFHYEYVKMIDGSHLATGNKGISIVFFINMFELTTFFLFRFVSFVHLHFEPSVWM